MGGKPPLWGGSGDLNNDRAAVPRIMRIETSLLRGTSGVPPCFMGGLPIEFSIFVPFGAVFPIKINFLEPNPKSEPH